MKYALPSLGAGVAGLIVGVVAALVDVPALAPVAGALALAAGLAAVRVSHRLDRAEARVTLLEADRAATQQAADQAGTNGAVGPSSDVEVAGVQSLTDAETNLFNEDFFTVALESRVAAARRHLRPLAMVLVEVVEGLPTDPRPFDATTVAARIRETIREADIPCRLRSGYFAILLEDTPENGAIWTVERIRRQLTEANEGLTVWAGIACYPAHAFSTSEIVAAADQALVTAREWPQDRIEVAAAGE